MNICAFPDLAQGEATINKKNLPVDVKKATLVVEVEINGEMYVFFVMYLSQMMILFIIGFEADLINLLQSFVFGKSPINCAC